MNKPGPKPTHNYDKDMYLRQYLNLLGRLEVLNRQYMEPKAISYSTAPKGRSDRTLNDYIQEKEKIEDTLRHIERVISLVEDTNQKSVLELYYLYGWTLESIAAEMNYSVSSIKWIKRQALTVIDI